MNRKTPYCVRDTYIPPSYIADNNGKFILGFSGKSFTLAVELSSACEDARDQTHNSLRWRSNRLGVGTDAGRGDRVLDVRAPLRFVSVPVWMTWFIHFLPCVLARIARPVSSAPIGQSQFSARPIRILLGQVLGFSHILEGVPWRRRGLSSRSDGFSSAGRSASEDTI